MESDKVLKDSRSAVNESLLAACFNKKTTAANVNAVCAETPLETVNPSKQSGVDVHTPITVFNQVGDYQNIGYIGYPKFFGGHSFGGHTIGYDDAKVSKHKINSEINKPQNSGKQMNGKQFFNADGTILQNTSGQLSCAIQFDKQKVSDYLSNNLKFGKPSNNGFIGIGQMLGYSISGTKYIDDRKLGGLRTGNINAHGQTFGNKVALNTDYAQKFGKQMYHGMTIDENKLGGTVLDGNTKAVVSKFNDQFVADAKFDQSLSNQSSKIAEIGGGKLSCIEALSSANHYMLNFDNQITTDAGLKRALNNQTPNTIGIHEMQVGGMVTDGRHKTCEQKYYNQMPNSNENGEMNLSDIIVGGNFRDYDNKYIDKMALSAEFKQKPGDQVSNVYDFDKKQLDDVGSNIKVYENKVFDRIAFKSEIETPKICKQYFGGIKVTVPNSSEQITRCIEFEEQLAVIQTFNAGKVDDSRNKSDYLDVFGTKDVGKKTDGLKFFQEDIVKQTLNNSVVDQQLKPKRRKICKKKKEAVKNKFVSSIEFARAECVEQSVDDIITAGCCDVFGTPMFGAQKYNNDVGTNQLERTNDFRIAKKVSGEFKNNFIECDEKKVEKIDVLNIGQLNFNTFLTLEKAVNDEMYEAVELGEVKYKNLLVDDSLSDKVRNDYLHELRMDEEQAESQKTINHVLCDQYTKFFTIDEHKLNDGIAEQVSDDLQDTRNKTFKKPKVLKYKRAQNKGKQRIIDEVFLNGAFGNLVHGDKHIADSAIEDITTDDGISSEGLRFANTDFGIEFSESETDVYDTASAASASEVEAEEEETDSDVESDEYENFYDPMESDECTAVEGFSEMVSEDCEETETETDTDDSEYIDITDTEESSDSNDESDDTTTNAFTESNDSDFDSDLDLQQFFDSDFNND